MSFEIINYFRNETEYHNMISSFNAMSEKEETLINLLDNVYKNSFLNFCFTQKSEIKTPLTEIQTHQQNYINSIINSHIEMQKIPYKMSRLFENIESMNNLMKEVLKKSNEIKSLKEQEKKIENKLNETQKKGKKENMEFLDEKRKAAKKEYDDKRAEYQTARRAYIQASDTFSVSFTKDISNVLGELVAIKKKQASSSISIGQGIIEEANKFAQPVDDELNELKKFKEELDLCEQ